MPSPNAISGYRDRNLPEKEIEAIPEDDTSGSGDSDDSFLLSSDDMEDDGSTESEDCVYPEDDDAFEDSSIGMCDSFSSSLTHGSAVTPGLSIHARRTDRTWSMETPALPEMTFTRQRNLKVKPNGDTPWDFFRLVFTDQIVEKIIQETNNNAECFLKERLSPRARIGCWKPVTKNEFFVFIGLLLHMGLIQISQIQDYWRKDKFYNIPFFPSHMSRDRFQIILRVLHFAPAEGTQKPRSSDRLQKIRPLLNHFDDIMDEIYYPSRELSIDESMISWRGRLSFRQYIKGKKHKFGVKLYMLAEPTGLVTKILVYTGAGENSEGGLGHAGRCCS
ncbi:piggyBac transposable element-derived protein 4-like [Ischnura elegans]|uniref:piggyBac transposable element-derived protein 4-like n=1 Tax=Ischnura elegans TaxID=197161 RepID=UPI001ED8BAEF|nr:piggyBac transposable element-derived protein 4-like [Ischnura elegans]